jgi:hypothetical protein
MKTLSLLMIFVPFLSGHPFLETLKYAGFYSYGKDIEKGRVSSIDIYPETDSTILFYLDLNRGAPSYNIGNLYGKVKIINNNGIFYKKTSDNPEGCMFKLTFLKNTLIAKTLEEKHDCPFGYGVYADGTFKKFSSKAPKYFISQEGDTTYFKKVSPQKYKED